MRLHAAYVDNTKHGDYIITDMREAGVTEAEGVHFTQQRKQEMAQLLRQRLAEGTLHLPYDRKLLDELNTETYTLTKTGGVALEHPAGTHDDLFWALALAVFAATNTPALNKPLVK
jgi:phage FluMu gp28-like protein